MTKQIPISIFTDPHHLSSRRFSSFMGLLLVKASNSPMISRARAYTYRLSGSGAVDSVEQTPSPHPSLQQGFLKLITTETTNMGSDEWLAKRILRLVGDIKDTRGPRGTEHMAKMKAAQRDQAKAWIRNTLAKRLLESDDDKDGQESQPEL